MNLAFFALATLWQNLFQTYDGQTFFEKTLRRHFANRCCKYKSTQKVPNFLKKFQIMLNLMFKEKLNFLYKFKCYTSSIYEICFHCDLLSFSWFRMNCVKCEGLPNPGFVSVKVQTEAFLKKDSRDFKNSFYLGFLWIPFKPGKQN